MRRFELVEGASSKFWEVEQSGSSLNIRWGRIGTAGQGQTKDFADEAKASAALAKLVAEKTGKGYAEAGVAPGASIGAAAPKPVRESPAPAVAPEPAPSPAPSPAAPAPQAPEGVPPWLAQGEPLLLPPEARALAYATRRHPQAVAPCTAEATLAAWQSVRERCAEAQFVIDSDATDVALHPVLQRMQERLQQPQPAQDIEADALLLAFAFDGMRIYDEHKAVAPVAVDYLVGQYGLPGAVDIYLAAAQGLQINHAYDRALHVHAGSASASASAIVSSPMGGGLRCPFGGGEAALRRHLAAAPQDVWAACADRIEAAVPGLHPARQPIAALLLPDRPALSNALALQWAAAADAPATVHWLLLTATDRAALAAAAKVEPGGLRNFWSQSPMVATLLVERGTDALPALAPGVEWGAAAEALAAIGTPEAVAVLAKAAGNPKVYSGAKAALVRLDQVAQRWPLAAIAALARVAAAGGREAGLYTTHLKQLLQTHSGSVDALRPWLGGAAQAIIDDLVALLAGPSKLALPEELPRVLAAPPWLAARKKAAAALALELLPLAPVEQWLPGERESALRLNRWYQKRYDEAAQNEQVVLDELGFADRDGNPIAQRQPALAALRQQDAQGFIAAWRDMHAERRKNYQDWVAAMCIPLLPPAVAAPFWNAAAAEAADAAHVAFAVASLGMAAAPGLAAMVRSKPVEYQPLAQHFGAVELAPLAARAFVKLKSVRAEGRAWLLRYPEHAACGLIAPALGKPGEARDCAGAALRLLCSQGHEALLMQVAARYGNEAVPQALRAVLDENPLDRFPAKRPALPAWWQPREWHRPELPGGKALPDEALDPLGQMLAFPTHEEVYAGIADVRAACTPSSLAAFGWDCFSAWLEAGATGKDNWALTALGLLGNDDTARKLTPLIRAWPGESAHARAVTGLDALAGIGTDVALMLLNGIAQKVKFKGLQDKAREKIDAIAEARGLTTEELEDRLAPDLGLDAHGTLRLDFGPRAYRVGFDETLKPYVRELTADGKPGARLADLPKPRASDDAALAKEATERFKLLKKDARTIASQQLLRLEAAMCTRRRWTPELFKLFLAEHPLVRHIVQRLVWGVYEGDTLKECFRVAEDGQCTTAADDPYDLPEGNETIGVPHALELPADQAAAFGQLFTDYEILQPFPQLGRDTHTLTDAERAAPKLERWKGVRVPTGRVLGLVNKGWRRGQAQDGGSIWYFTKPLGNGKAIELTLDPGIIVGMVDEYPEQTLGEVEVGQPAQWGEMQNAEPIGTLGSIEASELIRDMEGLRA